MKKILNNSICLLIVLCMIAGFIPVNAQAYEKKGRYRIHTLSQKKWITAQEYNEKYLNIYKIKVPSDGYIKVTVNSDKCTGKHSSRVPAMLYTSYDIRSDHALDKYHIANFVPGKHYVALKKGTYYFYPGASKLKFKWEHHAVSHGSNSRMSRAKKLTSGKNKRVCFAYGHEYTKWYKIKLTKKKKIQVFARRMESKSRYGRIFGPGFEAMVVNSKGKKINTTKLNENMQITGLLPKGTYYISLKRFTSGGRVQYYGDRLISLTVSRK